MKRFLLLALWPTLAQAQTVADAVKFSAAPTLGSARYASVAGAYHALGGDFSAITVNPASVGVFRNNEFALSLQYDYTETNTDYHSGTRTQAIQRITIPNMAFVATRDLRKTGRWRSASLAIYSNVTSGFNRDWTAQTSAAPISKLDYYADFLTAQGFEAVGFTGEYPSYAFDAHLAWLQYGIDTVPGTTNQYFSAAGNEAPSHQVSGDESGRSRESGIAVGANFDDVLYVGASISLNNISFTRRLTFTETTAESDTTTSLNYFTETTNENISGTGISASIGAIYRPSPWLRIGASLKAPTWNRLTSTFSSENTTEIDGVSATFESAYISKYRFAIVSPLVAGLGAAFILNDKGLISLGADYSDFGAMRLDGLSDNYSFGAENDYMADNFGGRLTVKAGAEYRVNSEWSVRAGYASGAQAATTNFAFDPSNKEVWAAGAGYRNADFYIDLGAQLHQSADQTWAFDSPKLQPINISESSLFFVATIGHRF